ncbi:MAG TPA: FG-GAP repeat protein, partial [Kofleriaceae bacterium]|nr:FG-GAP repeat protein [Kofleriaceae bacterium]
MPAGSSSPPEPPATWPTPASCCRPRRIATATSGSGSAAACSATRSARRCDAGAVELYQLRGGGTGVWTWLGELVAPDPQTSAGFGSALAFAGDQLLVGAPRAGRGAVYVYRRGADGWAWSQTIAADVTGVPANQVASLGFGSHLAADQALAVIGTAWTVAHVYQLSDPTAVHLATLATLGTPGDDLGDCASCGALAIHGTTAVLATYMRNAAGVRVTAFDAAHDWAGTELTEMLGDITYLAVALDADRLAVSRADTLRILERTAAGWGAPQDIALGAMFATDLAWRSTDLVMTAYHPPLASPFLVHTVQRIADTWQVDEGTRIADRGASGQFNRVAVTGDWVATGNP